MHIYVYMRGWGVSIYIGKSECRSTELSLTILVTYFFIPWQMMVPPPSAHNHRSVCINIQFPFSDSVTLQMFLINAVEDRVWKKTGISKAPSYSRAPQINFCNKTEQVRKNVNCNLIP